MIKLINLLKEAEEESLKPEELGDLGFILGKPGEKELFKKGRIFGAEEVDPATGAITTKVINLPKFDKLRKDVLSIRKEIQPFKFSSNTDVAKVSKEAIRKLTQANNLIFAIDRLIALEREQLNKEEK
jgi:hypothetical protein